MEQRDYFQKRLDLFLKFLRKWIAKENLDILEEKNKSAEYGIKGEVLDFFTNESSTVVKELYLLDEIMLKYAVISFIEKYPLLSDNEKNKLRILVDIYKKTTTEYDMNLQHKIVEILDIK